MELKKDRVYIGSLDSRIDLITVGTTQSETGAVTGPETIFITGLAAQLVAGNSGNEEEEGKITWQDNRKYKIRYLEQVLLTGTQMIIRDNALDYDITHVAPVGRKRWLILSCTKRE